MTKSKKIASAGGSTGEYVKTLVSMMQALQSIKTEENLEYLWFGENKSMEQTQANKL